MSSCSFGRALSKATVSASPDSPCDLKTRKFHRCLKLSSHSSENVRGSCSLSCMELTKSCSFKAFCLITFPLALTCSACCSQIHSKRAFESLGVGGWVEQASRSVVLWVFSGCLRAKPRSSDSEHVYVGYGWLGLLRWEASRKVRRRCLGLLVYSGYHRAWCQWTLCHPWSMMTMSGTGV